MHDGISMDWAGIAASAEKRQRIASCVVMAGKAWDREYIVI